MWLNFSCLEESLHTRFIGRRIVYLTTTASTQDVARSQAVDEASAGTAVIAEEQTAGRGRFGRRWFSPAGKNLYLTLIMRPPLRRLRALSILTPLAVCQAVEEMTGLAPRIKWPNDVLIEGRKLCGVLIESDVSGDLVRFALVGIGINVNLELDKAPELSAIATSLKHELGREVDREQVLAAVLNQFEELYERADDGDRVFEAWRSRLETLGQQVKVAHGDQVFEGVAQDVDADGNLVLLKPDGSRVAIEAGEVSLRSSPG